VNLLVRVLLIPLGYVVAIFSAVALLAAVEWVRAYPPVAGDAGLMTMTAVAVFTDALFMAALIGYTAITPTLVAVALAEIFSLRSLFFFLGAGLAIAGALTRLLGPDDYPALPTDPAIVAAAGLIGGLGYWLVCGRWSGLRRHREPIVS
jgi:hypothetical protein